MKVQGNGPIPSRIMLVGEYPSSRDEETGSPFSGSAGEELGRMLNEAGILRSECYLTNVVKYRPPNNLISEWVAKAKKDVTPKHVQMRDKWVMPQVADGYRELLAEIEMVQPNIIIAFGNLALWALTGAQGILKWRGSQLYRDHYWGHDISKLPKDMNLMFHPKVIPTIHPSAVLREWSTRALVLTDLRRVKKEMTSREYANIPKWNFLVRPSFDKVMETFDALQTKVQAGELWLDFDIETRANHIACVGVSWSRVDALCIPFMALGHKEGYWSLDEETTIIDRFRRLTTHSNARCRWQNGLFDAQYIYRYWHFIPNHGQDTMISQHSLFCALPKGLGFLGSMYADYYVYWKDEGKTWSRDVGEEQLWRYNLQDCTYTREVGEVLAQAVVAMNMTEVDGFQQSLFKPVLKAMLRGVRVREEVAAKMAMDIQEELSKREAFLYNVIGHTINPSSPKQMQALFYDDLRQKVITKRKIINGKTIVSPTCDDEALTTIATREPLLRPITNAIADIRTLGKFHNDFVMMKRDYDGRMRCSFNIAGDAGGKSAPYSYRLSSGKNPFGGGGNLQTIPSDKSKSSGKAAARGSIDFKLPNIRSMYGPDAGFTFFDMDLDRADLQVVVWETDDAMLKHALHIGADIHLLNVFVLDNQEPPPLEELVESHPKYPDHRGPRKYKREFAKVFCHATNYVGSAKTIAGHTGRSVAEVDRAQKIWFGAHPGIKAWHTRTETQINKYRFVENRFGYRWYIFDRLEGLLPEAVAWIPQSTVGGVINRAWKRIYDELPEVQVLLQVHDSLAGQFPTHRAATLIPKLKEISRIVIPYDDPLVIPTGVKTSTVSWGDCA
jgi:DNA polymerase